MPTKGHEFLVDESLEHALQGSPKWKVAHDAAKKFFDDLVSFTESLTATSERIYANDLAIDVALTPFYNIPLSLVKKFATKLDFYKAEHIVGRVSLKA